MEYLVSIGSNEGRRQNMLLARRRLSELFADIRFSCEEETAPLYLHRPCRFSNQVACFHSDLCADEVRACLKAIEREAGRLPEDKPREIVRLDIDLLMCDGIIIKADDWKREYVQRGLKHLNII
ncbi:MAG TPA: 2-amino-4-hydroxy-6-hydroxymethyldihydropteridine diphosphokinase [Candidatus Bacteroides merdavium]|uniref:2-amino-4-hydroxy-6-hydroxymethyldihydropteridine pyrophosphokinase n=1 Tax=Candidatus Bacteroides merdavium TaxID=2838472 RepID=A0A9D2KD17_9BACE|nr:2-amino-4-hydroxy-6-hydroxymethyldihydropteridine diphosphokinase [Candidatus Bacteroides merdavium]